jgi:hypothetical protein
MPINTISRSAIMILLISFKIMEPSYYMIDMGMGACMIFHANISKIFL